MTIRFATNRETMLLSGNTRKMFFGQAQDMGVRSHDCGSGHQPRHQSARSTVRRPFAGRTVMSLGLALAFLAGDGMLLAQRGRKDDQKVEVAEEKAPVAAGGASVDPHAYRIGAEDVLSIRVWREPDLSGPFTVRPDGKITLPLCGEVTAAGLTPVELTKKVQEAYAKLVNNPEIMLQVESVRSKKYFLVGEVNKAGSFPLVVPTTILEALNSAGGLREFANQKNITILRGDKRIKFNYKDVIRGKNLEQNILLENGDHIVVR